MLEIASYYRGYSDRLVEYLNCPCRTASPHPTACLNLNLGHGFFDRVVTHRRPRTARARRRRSRSTRGRSAEPSDDGGPGSNIAALILITLSLIAAIDRAHPQFPNERFTTTLASEREELS